jgi:hypothetical protein
MEIENSPRMNRIADIICENDGSLLWWDARLHAHVIGEGDVAIVFGDNSLKEAEFLIKQGGYPIKIMRAETL